MEARAINIYFLRLFLPFLVQGTYFTALFTNLFGLFSEIFL